MATTACDLCRTPLSADQLVTISGKTVCAKCKPDVVMNIKSGVGTSARVSPERAEEIKRRISRLNLMSFVFAVPGLALQFVNAPKLGSAENQRQLKAHGITRARCRSRTPSLCRRRRRGSCGTSLGGNEG